jgi:hypothetical protein
MVLFTSYTVVKIFSKAGFIMRDILGNRKELIFYLLILVLLSIVYFRPGIGENQKCFFAAANLAEQNSGVLDKFASVWEMKPVFHRVHIYMFHKAARMFALFENKDVYESLIKLFYFLFQACLIFFSSVLSRRYLYKIKVSPFVYNVFALCLVGIMPATAFEAEVMVFPYLLAAGSMLLYGSRITVFLSTIPFFIIAGMKGSTALLSIMIPLIYLYVCKPDKKIIISFLTGFVFFGSLVLIFFIRNDLFFHEYLDSKRMLDISTVKNEINKIIIYFKGMKRVFVLHSFYPLVLFPLLYVILFTALKKHYKMLKILLIIFTVCASISYIQGKPFPYYQLTLLTPILIVYLAFCYCLSFGDSIMPEFALLKRVVVMTALIVLPVLICLLLGQSMFAVITVLCFDVLMLVLIVFRNSNLLYGKINILCVCVVILFSFTLNSKNGSLLPQYINEPYLKKIITNHAEKNKVQPTILYLTYGTAAYDAELFTSQRVFYPIPLKRYQRQQKSETALKTGVYITALEEIRSFNGNYVLCQKEKPGWFDISKYPDIADKLKNEYNIIFENKKYIIYFLNPHT